MIKERVQEHSIQLSWQEPEQPNGVITEYEIKYYEKVSLLKRERVAVRNPERECAHRGVHVF